MSRVRTASRPCRPLSSSGTSEKSTRSRAPMPRREPPCSLCEIVLLHLRTPLHVQDRSRREAVQRWWSKCRWRWQTLPRAREFAGRRHPRPDRSASSRGQLPQVARPRGGRWILVLFGAVKGAAGVTHVFVIEFRPPSYCAAHEDRWPARFTSAKLLQTMITRQWRTKAAMAASWP